MPFIRRFERGDAAARIVVLGLAVAALSVAPSPAVAQGVQYTLMPSTSYVRWDESVGLERSLLFGARALADFGSLVGLEGHYLQGGGIRGRFSESGLTDSLGAPLANSSLDVTDYGLALRVNLGGRSLAPFLRAGGSVLRFDNGGENRLRQIAVSYGGGLRINATPRIRAELFAEDMRFRLDRTALAAGATPGTDPARNDLRSNLVFGGGVGFVVGGQRSDDVPRERWSVASIPLEPFAGRIDFAEAGRAPQSLVGLRAGVDVGNYVGLRAFYMRGVTSDFSTFAGVRSVGGEAQFNLNAAPRFAPYLVLGGGSLALDAGGDGAPAPADRTVLILGGGMGFRLTDKFRLNVAARDFVAGRQTAFEDVSRARDLEHNWLYSAGVTLSLGRSRRGIAVLPTRLRADSLADSIPAVVLARRDSATRGDSVTRDSAAALSGTLRATADSADARRYHSATSVLLPIPTEGELYIRYGPPGPRSDSLRARVGGAADTLDVRTPPGTRDAMVADDLSRGDARLASALRQALAERWRADSLMIRQLIAEELRRQPETAPAPAVLGAPVAPQVAPAPVTAPPDADAAVVTALAADRDRARADALRLQQRLDSLEGAIAGLVAARDAEARGAAAAAQQGQRDALVRAALADSVGAAAAEGAAAAARADSAAAAAREGESAEREQRRSDALLVLERSVPSVTAIRESERGLVIVLGNSLFATGATALPARASVELRAVATALALYPDAQLAVEGHTDNTGPAELNQRLSEARAEAVRRALVSYGVGSERLTARGYGQDRPLADNATATGRAANRRAEVVVLGVRRPPPVTTR